KGCKRTKKNRENRPGMAFGAFRRGDRGDRSRAGMCIQDRRLLRSNKLRLYAVGFVIPEPHRNLRALAPACDARDHFSLQAIPAVTDSSSERRLSSMPMFAALSAPTGSFANQTALWADVSSQSW